jgi:hypothetical protein
MELFITFIFIFIGNMRIIHTNIRKLYDVYENRKYNKYTNGAGTAYPSGTPEFTTVFRNIYRLYTIMINMMK